MAKIKEVYINHRKKIIIILLLGAGLFASYKLFLEKKNEKDITETEPTIYTIKKGKVSSTISASGRVETANYLAITTSVNGIVKEVLVQEGDAVTKGQKIMEITLSSDGEESLAQAWSSYLSAKNSLGSAKNSLYSKESAMIQAEEDFEDEKENNSYQSHDERISYKLAENDYLSAKAAYELQQDEITKAQVSLNKAWLAYQAQSPIIAAPDSGTIANIVVVQGMDITNSLSERTSSTVASIKKEGTPIASLDINELDIVNVKVGQKVRMELNSAPDEVFTGAVVGIDKIGTSSGGVSNYPVIIKFDDDSEKVLPNMGVEAEIIVEELEDVTFVPNSAINKIGEKSYVTIAGAGEQGEQKQNKDDISDKERKSTAERKPGGKTYEDISIQNNMKQVEVGLIGSDNTQIVSGLKVGDQIMISAFPTTGFTSEDGERPSGPGGGIMRIPR